MLFGTGSVVRGCEPDFGVNEKDARTNDAIVSRVIKIMLVGFDVENGRIAVRKKCMMQDNKGYPSSTQYAGRPPSYPIPRGIRLGSYYLGWSHCWPKYIHRDGLKTC